MNVSTQPMAGLLGGQPIYVELAWTGSGSSVRIDLTYVCRFVLRHRVSV